MQNKTISERIAELKDFYSSQKLLIGENDIVIGECFEIIEMQREALETISDGNEDGYVFDKSAEEGSDGECACHYADRILEKTKQLSGE